MSIRARFRTAIPAGVAVATVAIVAMATLALASHAFVTPRPVSGDGGDGAAQAPPIDLTQLGHDAAWIQVNKKPYRISSVLNVLCDAPRPSRVEEERKRNPHASTVVTVYVNDIGRAAMFSPTPIAFPRGSVIVKQKFEGLRETEQPLLSTVMIKREAGFNPEAGDWEFAVVGGDGREVRARGALANCIACHVPQKANDFVFRSYVER